MNRAFTAYSPYYVPLRREPLKQPRRLRVVCVGAGFAGLTLAYKILHELPNSHFVDFVIYERQSSVGGTWLANHYPGLTCDVPIHVYTLPWAPKHDWSSFMASGEELLNYIKDVNKKFDLERCIKFNTELKEASWDEDLGQWRLKIVDRGLQADDHCDILIGAVGTQNTPAAPDIPGMRSFRGEIVHTGSWNDKVKCAGKRVAVIGNGSSGIQVFGALQPVSAQITHYIRKPTWISMNYLSQFSKDGSNFKYTEEEKEAFKDPNDLFAYRQKLESVSNALFMNLVFDETCQDVKAKFRETTQKSMEDKIAPEMRKRLIPSYQPWCRRLTPGDQYLPALQASNSELIDSPIESVTDTAILTRDGCKKDFDVIVTASGFKNNRILPWDMTGKDGINMKTAWKDHSDGYISVCAPSMPNYFSIGCGPNFPIANGSVLSAFGFVSDYILKWIEKIAKEDIKSVCVKDDVVEAYNIYIQEVLRRTAWNRECDSWYKKGKQDEYRTGITAIYPGSMNHFKAMLQDLRGEDFNITYLSPNRWRFYGNGLTQLDLDNGNLAWYLKHTMKLDNMI